MIGFININWSGDLLEEAVDRLKEIKTLKGSQFDPDIVDVLLRLFAEGQLEKETLSPHEQ